MLELGNDSRENRRPWTERNEARLVEVGGWGIDLSAHLPPAVHFETLKLGFSEAQVLDNVLPAEWCAALITSHEKVGFTPRDEVERLARAEKVRTGRGITLSTDKAPEVRANTSEALTLNNTELASTLFERVRAHVPPLMKAGHTADGVPLQYSVAGVAPELRFMRYSPGQFFKPHLDPTRLASEHPVTGKPGCFQSFVTLAVYLNAPSEFGGGALTFIEDLKTRSSRGSVLPAVGRCAIFHHKELHEGGEVFSGTKHMVQCDLLYERVED